MKGLFCAPVMVCIGVIWVGFPSAASLLNKIICSSFPVELKRHPVLCPVIWLLVLASVKFAVKRHPSTSAPPVTYLKIPCAKPTPSVKKPMVDREEPKGRPLSVDDPSEVVLQEQLKSVAACSEIRNAVTNEDLQRLIRKIESSEDAESELDKAMEGDVFRIFTDKILSAINP
ncbi:hypothetical protein CRG98_043540 [Punica granatum]|uniref:Uncharacterized protein n=1 Tax=Punica granatum TaxID=22663 RepID=A0A2I0HWH9_PUNGR|nr:hypothetical protein CRG98_043540 [Punica granatum]